MRLDTTYQFSWFDAITRLSTFPHRSQVCTLFSTHPLCGHEAITHPVGHSKRNISFRSRHSLRLSIFRSTTEVPNYIFRPYSPRLALTMNPFSLRTTKSTATTLMTHIPPKTDRQYTNDWVDTAKKCD